MAVTERSTAISLGRAVARVLRTLGIENVTAEQRRRLREIAAEIRAQRRRGWQQAFLRRVQAEGIAALTRPEAPSPDERERAAPAVQPARAAAAEQALAPRRRGRPPRVTAPTPAPAPVPRRRGRPPQRVVLGERQGQASRRTQETQVTVRLALDGTGRTAVNTGIALFDHLLEQMAFHGLLDLEVIASGDREGDAHHVVEDVAIVLGQALNRALGTRQGIARFGSIMLPMDEALAQVAIDVDGRGMAVVNLPFYNTRLGQLPLDLLRHFFETLAREARVTIHVNLLRHWEDHHGAEGVFKAFGRALEAATRIDPRRVGLATSTKEL